MSKNPNKGIGGNSELNTMASQATLQQAIAHHQRGQLSQAQPLYERFLKEHPRHVDALQLFAQLAYQTGKHELAVGLLSTAIESNPWIESLYSNIGLVLQELKRFSEALANYDKVLAMQPAFFQAWSNRGNTLMALNRVQEALLSYDRAIALRPDFAEAHHNRGNALKRLNRLDDAVLGYNKAIEIKPDYADAYHSRGNVLRGLKRMDEAVLSFSKALALRPDFDFLPGTLLHAKMMICDWRGLEESLGKCIVGIQSSKKIILPFPALALFDSPDLHRKIARTFVDARFPAMERLGKIGKRPRGDRIRVGYYSADFFDHATTYLIAGLFEAHDATKFELFGFSFGPRIRDAMYERVSSALDHFFEVGDKSDLEIAQYSRELGIDIAVDLKGITTDSRLGIFAERCAPIQVNYLGYPGTLGANYMDYIVADATVIPKDQQQNYLEKIVYLPDSYQVNDSRRRISERVFTRQECGLPEAGFVFCCFNNNYKILPATFDAWMRILKSVGDSVLWLIDDNPAATANLRNEAASRGVDVNRLVFAGRIPLGEHLARHRLADLFIDTAPYNAHTTASDALWAGLPVLTCTGRSFAGKVAASLLHAMELPELITVTMPEYEAKAIELASNAGELLRIKTKLANNKLSAALFDTALFARHLESAYEAMYERYHAGLKPEHITVPAARPA